MREFRTIGFEEQEMLNAALGFFQRTRRKLPSGSILGIKLNARPMAAEILIQDDDGGKHPIKMTAGEIAAALVAYCVDRRVLLPSKGKKTVEVIGSNVNLIIILDDEEMGRKKKAKR